MLVTMTTNPAFDTPAATATPMTQATPANPALLRNFSVPTMSHDMPPTQLVRAASSAVLEVNPKPILQKIPTRQPEAESSPEEQRKTLARVLCERFPRAERCTRDVLESRISKFAQWDLPAPVQTIFCTRAPRCSELEALNLADEKDRAAALAASAVDPRVSKFKPQMVPKHTTEEEYFTNYLSWMFTAVLPPPPGPFNALNASVSRYGVTKREEEEDVSPTDGPEVDNEEELVADDDTSSEMSEPVVVVPVRAPFKLSISNSVFKNLTSTRSRSRVPSVNEV